MAMPMSMSGWDTAGAVLLVLWALAMWTAVGVLAYADRGPVRPWVYRGALGVIGFGVLGQLGHVQEHVAQVGYWLGHPNSPAWMTPWGTGLANGLQLVLPGRPTFGMELLHLTGNFLFLAGLAGVMVITRRATGTRTRRWAKMGVWMQGLHGLEHLVLTLSIAFGAPRAIGLSTFFGLVDPGPGLTTYRVWWHFTANVLGSVVFGLALYHLWRERREIRAGFLLRPLPAVTRRAA
ncbi:hypothetical protein SAMN04489727_5579 [Amycolatopsis tolypomycina]|uniref:Uncharacterized protein n=1 Tax=Amycolatopsis tolypomycina TaxID=208445 RepID=A0A1H4WFN3_9PSEU|nr:DUF6008 family protein [Amycolatopsis tolypomycina]SEC91548.1 hypothetical protein SAMN04489727_5579 [Amycolatopsis tolypomycina]